ncbi:MAG: multiheme c-type cytochrome [Pirellulaceae bacterium]|nr:multiheme c-type cytochrome [Pirellulaceae bacterium]
MLPRFWPRIPPLALLVVCAATTGCQPVAELAVPAPVRITTTSAGPTKLGAHFVGHLSCVAAGCHGAAFSPREPAWRSAATVWEARDPHRQAFLVLYTERSVEIYRNLHPDERDASRLDDDRYFRFLQQRCISCHATGTQGDDRAPIPSKERAPADYLAGVSCESCHGPAGQWLHTHYLANATPTTPGFISTKDLWTRAGVCVGCHVGPMVTGDTTYDMNHDLIAAGHPRLAFEFDAYLLNLPKHWNEIEDKRQHRGSFHVDAWRFGQVQSARQVVTLLAHRAPAGHDFANFDCYACHHPIRDPSSPTSVAAVRHTGYPRLWGADPLLAITGDPSADALHSWPAQIEAWNRQHGLFAPAKPPKTDDEPTAKLPDIAKIPPLTPLQPADLPSHAAALRKLLSHWRGGGQSPRKMTWDETVQLYLAVQALARDLPSNTTLATANEDLFDELSPLASGPYSTPQDPNPTRLALLLDNIDGELSKVTAP